MTARKKANDLIFWARQFAYGGEPKWTPDKKLACQIHNAKQIAMCSVGEVEKIIKSQLKREGRPYPKSKEYDYWTKVLAEIHDWKL